MVVIIIIVIAVLLFLIYKRTGKKSMENTYDNITLAKQVLLKDTSATDKWNTMQTAENEAFLAQTMHIAKTELVEEGHTDLLFDLATDYFLGNGCEPDPKEAQRLDFLAAKQNDTNAILRTARLYSLTDEHNDIYPPNDEESIKWYTKGAELGSVQCQAELGEMYMYSSIQNRALALKYSEQAAENDNLKAMENIIELCKYSRENIDKAVYWCQKAIERGSERALILKADIDLFQSKLLNEK